MTTPLPSSDEPDAIQPAILLHPGNHLQALGRVEAGVIVHKLKLGVVECVVKFSAELEIPMFAPQRKLPIDADIPVVQTWPAKRIFGGIPISALARPAKRRGVEPAVKTALATGQLGRANEICPKEAFVSSTGQIRIVCGADIDSLGQTAGKGSNAGQSPVIQNCTGKGVRPFSAGFGKVPDVIDR